MLRGLAPVIGPASRLLVLGSFPGEASLDAGRYYAHPRNQFWPILAAALGQPLLDWPFERRYRGVLDAGLAIWDVYAGCRREGSLDSSIRDAAANDFESLARRAPALRAVLFNGRTAARSQQWFAARGFATRVLPSTSPAYAGMSAAEKLAHWSEAIAALR
ncbi:MAG: DNA-deoxyinosine glycosylase [Burkholderiales bacterium]|nr:MAG: DNA-deoxyinosine glycosylase [Burkholderiales bacterium]